MAMTDPAPTSSPCDPAAVRAAAGRVHRDLALLLRSDTLEASDGERSALLATAVVAAEVHEGDRRA